MEVLNLLEILEDMIEESSKMPLGNKVLVDKGKALELIRDIRIGLPDELKQAEWINVERQRIIDDAQREAEKAIKDSEEYIKEKVSDHEITKKAEENAKEVIRAAKEQGKEIKEGAKEYALEILKKVESDIGKLNSRVQKNMQELRDFEM
mgnify:CR=1 FL=1